MKVKTITTKMKIWIIVALLCLIGIGFFLPKTAFSASAAEVSSQTVEVTLVDEYSEQTWITYATVGENFSFIVPSSSNYTFNGWKYGEELLTNSSGVGTDVWSITQDVTLTADCTPTMKMIQFDTGCDTLTVESITLPYKTRTELYSEEDMQRDGYIFAGWYDGVNGTGIQYATADGNMVRDWDKTNTPTTLYAKWDLEEYTINFYIKNNTTPARVLSYTIESNTITLESYEQSGKRFIGWYDNEDYENASKIIEIPTGSTGDRNLYAWHKQLYTISYKVDSTIVKTVSAVEGELVKVYKYDKTGYTAIWKGGYKANSTYTMSASNVTLTVEKWDPHKFTIRLYDSQGVSTTSYTTFTVTYGQSYKLPTMSAGFYYVFMGWYAKDGHDYADYLPQQQRFTDHTGQSLQTWNYDYAINLIAEYGGIAATLVNWYSRDNTYTITDSGRFNQSYDIINIKDYCGYSAKELYEVGYRSLYITVQLDIWEKNYGYQYIFIYNGTGSDATLLDDIQIEHGGTDKKTSEDRYNFTFQVPLTANTSDVICVRYGASGSLKDDWCNQETVVWIDASTDEDLMEPSYYIM